MRSFRVLVLRSYVIGCSRKINSEGQEVQECSVKEINFWTCDTVNTVFLRLQFVAAES
jgi:hypothetical protein